MQYMLRDGASTFTKKDRHLVLRQPHSFLLKADIDFDIKGEHKKALANRERPKVVIDRSLHQQVRICMENSTEIDEALLLTEMLKEEIDFRVRVFCRCLSKTSESYVKWLQDEYKRKLKITLIHNFQLMAHVDKEQMPE